MPFVDIHILQTVPPSNINRDDTGSPKTAQFGGVRRARVSSQAWKRATRKRFNETLDRSDIGWRTKRIVELLAETIVAVDSTVPEEEARTLASAVLKKAGLKLEKPRKKADSEQDVPVEQSGYLVFMSAGQFQRLAEAALRARSAGTEVTAKEAKEAFVADQSFDVALFGRMVADDAELNVDAAAQVAHAISVHAVDNEADYFTAVDDLQQRDQESGAGMIGTVEFNSSTLYRYATVNTDALRKNLGDSTAAARATAAFIEAFATSMPSGKRNTFANGTLPDLILVDWRDDLPVNLAGAFEDPISREAGGISGRAAEALTARRSEIADVYGPSTRGWAVATGPARIALRDHGQVVSLQNMVVEIEQAVAAIGEPS